MNKFLNTLSVLLLPNLDNDCNPLPVTEEDKVEAICSAIRESFEYCDTCKTYMVPGCHNCDGPNRVIWP